MRRLFLVCLLASAVVVVAAARQDESAPDALAFSSKRRKQRNLRIHQDGQYETLDNFWETFIDPLIARLGDVSMSMPTRAPSKRPKTLLPTTATPTPRPTRHVKTAAPSKQTKDPRTSRPSSRPTLVPSWSPTDLPRTRRPSLSPVTPRPTRPPKTWRPTNRPTTKVPTKVTLYPTVHPTVSPTIAPTEAPTTEKPSNLPSRILSRRPTSVPETREPTDSPMTSYPSNTPITRRPTRRPSDLPTTSLPSKAPITGRPTRQPTDAPTTSLSSRAPITSRPTSQPSSPPVTKSPTKRPSPAPVTKTQRPNSLQPTRLPTMRPATSNPTTSQPTKQPTRRPATSRPTRAPTRDPSRAPVATTCEINLNTRCEECENLPMVDPTCQGAPTRIVMRFVGGTCDESSTSQDIACFDFGTISKEPGARVYVMVQFRQSIYFSGFVRVGQDYVLQSPNGTALGPTQSIVIYRNDNLSPSNVLQSLVYVGDCSEPLRLKSQFGASQVVGFTVNGESTKAFEELTVTQDVSVPATSASAVQLVSLSTQSNLRNLNLTDTVAGTDIRIGQATAFSFDVTVDVTMPREYNFVSAVRARTPGDSICSNVSLYSFQAPGLAEFAVATLEAAKRNKTSI